MRISKIQNINFCSLIDDSELIRNLYKDFYVCEYSLQYGMNNYKQIQAAKGVELLISNFSLEKCQIFMWSDITKSKPPPSPQLNKRETYERD